MPVKPFIVFESGNELPAIDETKLINQEIICKKNIKLTQNEEKIEIGLVTGDNGNLKVEIFDIRGELVYSEMYNKSSYEFNVSIDNRMFTSGCYYYKITLNVQQLCYNKFIIIR